MIECRVDEVGPYDGREVRLHGWLYHRRESGKIQFLELRDGTGVIQAVVSLAEAGPEVFDRVTGLPQESSLAITGLVRADRRAPGGYELQVREVEIYQRAEEYPISPKEHGTSFLLDQRHLWLRSSRPQAILRIRAEVIRLTREFFDSRGFLLVDAPILTPAACEGTTTLFETEYFGQKAYLSQSGQLYNEAAAMAFGRVYCFGPTFRAEKSKTRRHLTEFWMVEPEMAFADLDEAMRVAEDLVLHLVQGVLARRERELVALGRELEPLRAVRAPFPRVSYTEAREILLGRGLALDWGEDLGAPHETALSQEFGQPVFVHRFPAQVRAFYMRPDPANADLALGMDLLAPEGYGEIVGGGERLAELPLLEERIRAYGLPRESFEWYLDLRRYGSVPHAGFGMGIERVVAWLAGLDHLREAVPFPRTMTRIYP